MIINPAAANIQHNFWEGPPEPTWHTHNNLMTREETLAYAGRGQIIDIFGDTETNHRNSRIAQIKSFSGIKLDLAGRKLAQLSTEAAFPPHIPIGFIPALIGGFSPEAMQRGWPVPVFAAMIYDFLQAAARLDPVKMGLRPILVKSANPNGNQPERLLYDYVIPCAGGASVTLYVHESGEKFILPDQLENGLWPEDSRRIKWQKIYATNRFYNGDGYDNTVLAHNFFRQGFPEQNLTTSKSNNACHSDPLALIRLLALVGDQGAAGIKAKLRYYQKHGVFGPSFRLADIFEMNDLHALHRRGVRPGPLDFEGRAYDPHAAHDDLRDTGMAAALFYYSRKSQWDKVNWFDSMAFREKYETFFNNPIGGVGNPEVFGLLRWLDGKLQVTYGTPVGIDREQNDWRRGLAADLGYKPEAWMNLPDAAQQDMIRKRNGALVPVRLTHSPIVFPQQWAEEAGYLALDRGTRNYRRTMIHAKDTETHRAMENFAATLLVPVPDAREVMDYRHFVYGQFGYLQRYEMGEPGEKVVEPPRLYQQRKYMFAKQRNLLQTLNAVLRPPRILYENTSEALQDYCDNLNQNAEKLKEIQKNDHSPFVLPDTGIQIDSVVAASMDYFLRLWACRATRFAPSKTMHVFNGYGQQIDWKFVLGLPSDTLHQQFPLREQEMALHQFRLQTEPIAKLYETFTLQQVFSYDHWIKRHPEAVDPQFLSWWQTAYIPLWEAYRESYEALVAVDAVHGPPGIPAGEHHYPTVASQVTEAQAYLAQPGQKLLTANPHERELAADLLSYFEQQLRRVKLTARQKMVRGYDPQTGQPVLSVPRIIIPDSDRMIGERRDPAFSPALQIPERLLETGLHSDSEIYPAAPFMLFRKLRREITDRLKHPSSLILESETGRQRLLADAMVMPLPDWTQPLQRKLEFTAEAYHMTRRDPEAFSFVTGYHLFPIATGEPVDQSVATVELDPQRWNGLVAPNLLGWPTGTSPPPVTCIITLKLKQDYQARQKVRLCRTEGGTKTGDEFLAILKTAEVIDLETLRKMRDVEAQKCGAINQASLYTTWASYFAHYRTPAREQRLWRLELTRPADSASYRYFNPNLHPIVTQPRRADREAARVAAKNPRLFAELAA